MACRRYIKKFDLVIDPDTYTESDSKYMTEIEKVSNLIDNKLKIKSRAYTSKNLPKQVEKSEYLNEVFNGLIDLIGLPPTITNIEELNKSLTNGKDITSFLKSAIAEEKKYIKGATKSKDAAYSAKYLLEGFLRNYEYRSLDEYSAEQLEIAERAFPALFKDIEDTNFKSKKQALGFYKVNLNKISDKVSNIKIAGAMFHAHNAKLDKYETLLNYQTIAPKDFSNRIVKLVKNELDRREKFFTSPTVQKHVIAKKEKEEAKRYKKTVKGVLEEISNRESTKKSHPIFKGIADIYLSHTKTMEAIQPSSKVSSAFMFGGGTWSEGEINVKYRGPGSKEHVTMHELTHHFSVPYLRKYFIDGHEDKAFYKNNPERFVKEALEIDNEVYIAEELTSEEIKNIRRLENTYKKVLQLHKEGKISFDNGQLGGNAEYGLSNLYEFVAEAISNPMFAKVLSEVPGIYNKKSSLLKDIIDSIFKIFGIKDASLLDDVYYLFEETFLGKDDKYIFGDKIKERGATENIKKQAVTEEEEFLRESFATFFEYTGEQVESILYNDLRDSYGERIADSIYDRIYTREFKEEFGDWQMFPEKYIDKLDKNGEPKIEAISSTPESNRAYKILVEEKLIAGVSVNGLFPRMEGVGRREITQAAKELGLKVKNIGDFVSIEGKGGDALYRTSAFYSDNNVLGVKQIDLAKEEAWFKKTFGENVKYERVKRLVDGHAWGAFRDASVYVYEFAEEGTMYHEAFHATTQLFLTPSERRSLYAEFRRRDGVNEDLTNAEIEEILADEFIEFVESEGKFIVPEAKKEQKSFFRELLNTIREAIFGKRPNIQEVYQSISSGKFAKPLSLSTRAVRFLNKINAKTLYRTVDITYPTYKNGEKTGEMVNATITQKRQIVEGFNKFFMDILFQDGDPEALFSKDEKFLNIIYNGNNNRAGVKDYLIESLKDSEREQAFAAQYGLDRAEEEIFKLTELLEKTKDATTKEKIKKEINKWEKTKDDRSNFISMIYEVLSNEGQWNNLLELHKKHLNHYGIIIKNRALEDGNEIDTNLDEITLEQGRNNFQESIKFDTKDSAPKAIKMLIGSITKLDDTQTPSINAVGLNSLVDYNETYNYIARNLAGLPSEWPIFKQKLESLVSTKPELQLLLDRLSGTKMAHEHLRTKFVQTFSKTMYSSYIVIIKKDDNENNEDIYLLDANSNKITDRIRDKWRTNFGNNIIDDSIIANVNYHLEKGQVRAAFLELGMEFSSSVPLYSPMSQKEGGTTTPAKMLQDIVNFVKDEKIGFPDDLYNAKSTVAGRINDLIELEAKHNTDIVDLQHINTEGQTVYGITLPTYITLVTGELNYIASLENRSEREDELEKRLPHLFYSSYAKDSLILDNILDGNAISVGLFDGLKVDSPGSEGASLKNLTEGDKYVQLVNSTLYGKFTYLRAADRGIENIFTINNLNSFAKNEEEALRRYTDYLRVELETARNLKHKGEGANVAYYKDIFEKDKHGLRVFSDIIKSSSVRTLVNISDDVEFEEAFESDTIQETIESDIKKYLKRRYSEELQYLSSLGAIKYQNGEYVNAGGISKEHENDYKGVEEAVKHFVWNNQISYIEQSKVFTGDFGMYKTSTDATKRFSMPNSSKKISRIGTDMDVFLNDKYIRKDGKIANRRYIKTLIYEDVLVASKQLEYYTDVFTKGLLEDGFGKNGKLSPKGISKLKGLLKPYTEMEEGDGAGGISLDEYRDLLNRSGDWTLEHDKVYSKAIKGQSLKPWELFYLQPLKTQYTGPLTDSEFQEDGIYVHSGYKHALFPLIPAAFTKEDGTKSNMNDIIDHMLENQIGIWQFRSGNKYGTKLNLDKAEEEISRLIELLEDATTKEEKTKIEKEIKRWEKGVSNDFYVPESENSNNHMINTNDLIYQEIDYKYLGIQLDIAPKIKEEITAGTQIRKIILSNIYENGVPVNKELGELATKYNELQNEIIAKETAIIMEELSIEVNKDGKFEITNPKKLVEILTKTAEKRGVSDNVLEAINDLLLDDGSLGNIDMFPNREKIENLLMAIINNNVIREKRKGHSKVQAPSSGFETELRTKDENGNFFKTNEELAFYEEGKPYMEVMIALPKILLKKYGSLEKANEALRNGELDDLMRSFSFRIPTQAINSADSVRVKKFLPPELGDIVIMPTDIVAKAGSDYDIDKLSMYFKAFDFELPVSELTKAVVAINRRLTLNNYGDLLFDPTKEKSMDDLQKILEEGDDNIDALDDYENLVYRTFESQQIKLGKIIMPRKGTLEYLKNELLDISIQIIEHPVNRRHVLAPISDILLIDSSDPSNTEPLVNDIRELSGTQVSEKSYTKLTEGISQNKEFKNFMSGKAGIGQDAVHITNHVLTQMANTYIKEDVGLFFDYNRTNIDGIDRPSLAGIKSKDTGEWISETLSAFMNAYVDIAKDPYIIDLNAGSDTANTIFYMLRLGVDPKWLGRFMAQPVIQEFMKINDVNKSQFTPDKYKSDIYAEAMNKVKAVGSLYKNTVYKQRLILENEKKYFSLGSEKAQNAYNSIEKTHTNYRNPEFDELGDMIKKYSKDRKFTSEEAKMQGQILDNFMEYQRHSGFIQKMIRATSPDTKGTGKNINSLKNLRREKYEVLNTDNFLGNVEEIFDNTFIGAFQNVLDMAYDAYTPLTIMTHPNVVNELDVLKEDLANMQSTTSGKEKVRNRVDQEFLKFVMLTSHVKDNNFNIDHYGIDLNKEFMSLFETNENNPMSLPREIYQLQKGEHPILGSSLSENLIIKEFIPMLDRKKTDFDNMKFFSRRINTATENDLVEAFQEIIDKNEQLAVRLSKFALIQSGMATSPISFSKFIPSKLANLIIYNSIELLKEGAYIPNMTSFEQQFYRNNINLIPKVIKRWNDDADAYLPKLTESPDQKAAQIPFKKQYVFKGKNVKPELILYKRKDYANGVPILTKGKEVIYSEVINDYGPLGDGIYYSNYRIGENLNTEPFENEDQTNCLIII